MKKFIGVVCSSIIAFGSCIPCNAANGDVAGKIYSTDIMAYVNGVAISSYNIGGKTAVVIEDLMSLHSSEYNYGVNWHYDDSTRTLTADSQYYDQYFTKKEISRGKVGDVLGDIYSTDIKVVFNGKEVTSYNIGGKTAVCIEDLGEVTENSSNFKFGYSDYMCNFDWNEESREVSLNTYQSDYYKLINDYPIKKLEFVLNDNKLSCNFDQMNSYNSCLKCDFTEEFKNDIYKMKGVYIDDKLVGNMFMGNDGKLNMQLDEAAVYEKVKDLNTVLSYDEAKKYITDNFEIIDTYEDENVSAYIGQKDDKKYLMFALKKGGFVTAGTYEADRTVKFAEKDGEFGVTVYPYAGTHGDTVTLFEEYDTSGYNI